MSLFRLWMAHCPGSPETSPAWPDPCAGCQRLEQLLLLQALAARARQFGTDIRQLPHDDVVLRIGQRDRAMLHLEGLKRLFAVLELLLLLCQLGAEEAVRILGGQRRGSSGPARCRPGRSRWPHARQTPDRPRGSARSQAGCCAPARRAGAEKAVDARRLPAGFISGGRGDRLRRAEHEAAFPSQPAWLAARSRPPSPAAPLQSAAGPSHGFQRPPRQRPALHHPVLRLVEVVIEPAILRLQQELNGVRLRLLLDQQLGVAS